jgi:hypothetical protein
MLRASTKRTIAISVTGDFQQQSRKFAGSPNSGKVIVLLVCADGVFVAVGKARRTKMHWFRSRSRLGSCLALFALALQLALSFGHVHLGPVSGHASAGIVANSSDADKPSGRHQHHLPGSADDSCAVCALIHLAGTLVPSAAPVLPLPAASDRLPQHIIAQFDLSAPLSAHFQARAPPLA